MSQNQGSKPKPSEQLVSRLGFNPTKNEPITQEVLTKVLDEVKAERTKEAEERARKILKEALDLSQKMDKARRDFAKADAAYEKQLGQLLSQLNQSLGGGAQQQSQESDEPQPASETPAADTAQ